MAETDKHLCCVRCRECDLVTNPYDACTGMTEQERAAALVARSRRMSRHRRQRTQRSGSSGSGTSVADSVGSRRGSCSLDFGRRGKRRIRMLLAYAGRGIGGPSRSPAGDRSGLDVRSSGHPDPGVQSGESGRGEGLLGWGRTGTGLSAHAPRVAARISQTLPWWSQ